MASSLELVGFLARALYDLVQGSSWPLALSVVFVLGR